MFMRIGDFSRKFHLPVSTIRYYIENGLLIPIKINNQYRFSETDDNEMNLINKLKDMSFTLHEIKHFLQIVRMYNTNDYSMNEVIKKLYTGKREKIEKQLQQLTSCLGRIKMEINDLDNDENSAVNCRGVPLISVSMIACPLCGKEFIWDNVALHDRQIFSGLLSCECGYRVRIEDGIIVTESDNSFYKSEQFYIQHYQNIPDKDEDFVYFEYMNRISEKTTTMIHKAYAWIDAILSELKPMPRVIIMPDLSAHYLYKYVNAPYFQDALIIVSGFSKKNIFAIKSHFDAMLRGLNILYVANTIHEIPIKKSVIDLWIDAIASYNFSFFHNQESLHQLLSPYFTPDAVAVGLTKYLEPGSKSFQNIKRIYNRSHKENSLLPAFQRILGETGWELKSEEEHGYVSNPGAYYEYMDPQDKHWFYGYHAVKKR